MISNLSWWIKIYIDQLLQISKYYLSFCIKFIRENSKLFEYRPWINLLTPAFWRKREGECQRKRRDAASPSQAFLSSAIFSSFLQYFLYALTVKYIKYSLPAPANQPLIHTTSLPFSSLISKIISFTVGIYVHMPNEKYTY